MIDFHPGARQDVDQGVRYYAAIRDELADDFWEELQATVARIVESPRLYPEEAGGLRRAIVERFPFSVIYAPTGSVIEIVAVAHHSRRPDYWIDRI